MEIGAKIFLISSLDALTRRKKEVSSGILSGRIRGLEHDDILMKWVKGMKFFILVKLLQDDSKEKG